MNALPRIALLHSTPAVVPSLDAAARAPRVAVAHTFRDDLLLAAAAAGGLTPAIRARAAGALQLGLRRRGGLTPAIRARTAGARRAPAPTADAVLLTCATLGRCVEGTSAIRVDAALARAAKARGGRCAVPCAVETTLGPTGALFAEVGVEGAELRLVEGAWAAFRTGDVARDHALVRAAADAALEGGAACLALAQAAMAGAAAGEPRILVSPEAGLRAAAGLAA